MVEDEEKRQESGDDISDGEGQGDHHSQYDVCQCLVEMMYREH